MLYLRISPIPSSPKLVKRERRRYDAREIAEPDDPTSGDARKNLPQTWTYLGANTRLGASQRVPTATTH